MVAPRIEYRPNPLRQGSRNRRGDQVDSEFVHDLLAVMGDVRALWLPGKSGTTLTDRPRHARLLTWSEEVSSFDTKPAELGSGYAVTFNGTDEEGDAPDANKFSFGDGAVDSPFSGFVLINPDVINVPMSLFTKVDLTTGVEKKEWQFRMTGSGYPVIQLRDDSSNGIIGREDQTALTAGAWVLLAFTYDGSGAVTGIRVLKNGTRVDDANNNNGTYTAMEDTASLVRVGFRQGAAAGEEFFDGKMALIGLCARELSLHEMWSIKELANAYFGLAL